MQPVVIFAVLLVSAQLTGAQHGLPTWSRLSPPRKARSSNILDGVFPHASLYTVLMSHAPAVSYTGGIDGLPCTKPTAGAKINHEHPHVQRYTSHLRKHHYKAVQHSGAAVKSLIHSYTYSTSGFSAVLTPEQAQRLKQHPDVIAVVADRLHTITAAPVFDPLGLGSQRGLWRTIEGVEQGAGEGIVIGIIDSGIWPEHPSFSDKVQNTSLAFKPIKGWKGKCVPGEDFKAKQCNNKLIGCRVFSSGFVTAFASIKAYSTKEVDSCRDSNGHGTSISSIAAGNYGVSANISNIQDMKITGAAPRARISMYKACFTSLNDSAACTTADLIAAIDQAVADGVDIINLSLAASLGKETLDNPLYMAYMHAAAAGIFMATAGGNSGPNATTVNNIVPWTTTVAAATHSYTISGSLVLGDGQTFTGITRSQRLPSTAIIFGADAPARNSSGTDGGFEVFDFDKAYLCAESSLDPEKVKGKIVVCQDNGIVSWYGVMAAIDKANVVHQAGGIGMVLLVSPWDLEHIQESELGRTSVPTIVVSTDSVEALKGYIRSAGTLASGSIDSASLMANSTRAPIVWEGSSRGPAPKGFGDVLKPDVLAPGVDVFAAVLPGRAMDGAAAAAVTGTSAAAPFVAGVAAILKQRHPDWTPMMIKSALMTSAIQSDNRGLGIKGGATGYGAGHVQAKYADNPGLVFESGKEDWRRFLCAGEWLTQQMGSSCSTVCGKGPGGCGAPTDLNTPYIAIDAMTAHRVVTRTVRNVRRVAETYTLTVLGLEGFSATIEPRMFTVPPGGTQSFTLTLVNTMVDDGQLVEGRVVLRSTIHRVRVPVLVRAYRVIGPGHVELPPGEKSTTFSITSVPLGVCLATRGPVPAKVVELPKVPARVTADKLQYQIQYTDPDLRVTVPQNAFMLAISVTASRANADFVVLVFDDQNQYSSSYMATGSFQDQAYQPPAGPMNLWTFASGTSKDEPINITTKVWVIPGLLDPPGLTAGLVGIDRLEGGGHESLVAVNFTGLAPKRHYLGTISYLNSPSSVTTLVQVAT